MNKYSFILAFTCVFFLFIKTNVEAVSMGNSLYKLEQITGRPVSPTSVLPTQITIITPTPQRDSTIVSEYINPTFFSISSSSTEANYGQLNPGEPIQRKNTIMIDSGNTSGFSVYAIANHPLQLESEGIIIPDTTCDQGNCNETIAAEWKSPLTYGFGYRCDSDMSFVCMTEFSNSDYFKQFADNEKEELPQVIAQNIFGEDTIKFDITYKVNISKSQPQATYKNHIIFITAPHY